MICNRSHGVCDLLCLQTQLTDAQKRIADLEVELAAAKFSASSAEPVPCFKCLRMEPAFREVLAQRSLRPSTFSQAWRRTGEYNEVRSSAFANFVTHSGGTPRKVGCVVMFCFLIWRSKMCLLTFIELLAAASRWQDTDSTTTLPCAMIQLVLPLSLQNKAHARLLLLQLSIQNMSATRT